MISQETVWTEVWPTVKAMIEATLAEDEATLADLLVPGEEAAVVLDLFGTPAFDVLLKTVLERDNVAVTRAIATEGGRYVHIEFAWPIPEPERDAYTVADLVTVQLLQHKNRWRVVAVNPAAVDFPMTEGRALTLLISSGALAETEETAREPWILPVAFLAGNLQLSLRAAAMADEVEAFFLRGMQHRAYGLLSLVAARRLWRAFSAEASPALEGAAAWAAAVEFIMSEQAMRDQTQAAVAKHYQVSLAQMLPHVRAIKDMLGIKGLDERFTPLQRQQIVLHDGQDKG